ncbi:hypothetical protein KNV00_gp027 [Streptomyces phage Bmoc]|uniref:Uncharacterized protein n=1 Tax=Streptomyces phage Bmoc TaxID=2725629 RepID=A0A6M3SYD3_9CAUD|nr:hypothetical protein KNV00_gp027 [Streptomyces phage Bmoc]QJD50777.1 hypothetical protein SEA_BMOC_27 [Streptomyces phage Bmoc]
MTEIQKALNSLYEQRRVAQGKVDRANKAGNRVEAQRWIREVRRFDGAIKALEEK